MVDATDDPGGGLRRLLAGVGIHLPAVLEHVACQVLDANGGVATGTFQVDVAPTTRVLRSRPRPLSRRGPRRCALPSMPLTADAPGVTKRGLRGDRRTLSDDGRRRNAHHLRMARRMGRDLGAQRRLQPEKRSHRPDHYADASTGVSITVNNPLPTTSIAVPSTGGDPVRIDLPRRLSIERHQRRVPAFRRGPSAMTPRCSARPRLPTTDGCAVRTPRRSPTARTHCCIEAFNSAGNIQQFGRPHQGRQLIGLAVLRPCLGQIISRLRHGRYPYPLTHRGYLLWPVSGVVAGIRWRPIDLAVSRQLVSKLAVWVYTGAPAIISVACVHACADP